MHITHQHFAMRSWESESYLALGRHRGSSAPKKTKSKGTKDPATWHTHVPRHRFNTCLTHPRGLKFPFIQKKQQQQQRCFLLCLESSHHRRWRTNWIHPKIIKGLFDFRRSPALEHHHRARYSTRGIKITWGERSKQQCMTVLPSDSVTTLILIKCRRCPAVAALAATLMQSWCQTRSPTHKLRLQPSDKKEIIKQRVTVFYFFKWYKRVTI